MCYSKYHAKATPSLGFPSPMRLGYNILRKEEGSSEEQQISQSPRGCRSPLVLSDSSRERDRGARVCLSSILRAVSYKSWFPWWWASLRASRIHVWWRDGTRQRRVAWVCNSVNCHLSFVFIASEQDVGRCFLQCDELTPSALPRWLNWSD